MKSKITYVSFSTYSSNHPFVDVTIHRDSTTGHCKTYYHPTPSSIVRIIRVQAKRALEAIKHEARS